MNRFSIRALLTVATLSLPAALHAQRHELTGNRVAIYNLVGTMRIEAGTGSSTTVEVTRNGRDAASLDVRTFSTNGVSTLVVRYPGDDIVAENMERGTNTTIGVNDNGTFNGGRATRRVRVTTGRGDRDAIHAQADIIVRLAPGTSIDANLAVGSITANNTSGALDLETSSGDIASTGNRGEVKLESASGDLTVTNATGDVEVETASGDIEINGITGKRVDAETASGTVTVTGVTADDVEVESASGNVRVARTRAARLKAESASGNVRAELDGDVREISVSTASGDAEVVVPSAFSGEVEMETASGDIDIDFELRATRRSRGHLRATIGDGGNGRISLETASGDVRLLRR
jgi:DUF4097 and DUF4098 domain-containing protein YvlB